jgi:DsbC/DsbD-like thiol-disulfide interchange protein
VRFLLLGTCLTIAIAGPLQTVNPGARLETAHVSIALSSSGAMRPGRPVLLHVDIAPKPKMHVYAPGEKDQISVDVTLDRTPAITAGKTVFPPPEKYFFPPLKLTQLVYSKPFRLTVPVTLTKAPPDGVTTIKGTLTYQACDDAVCFIPKSVPVAWTLNPAAKLP